MLEGANVVVIDCETLRSSQDCRFCFRPFEPHARDLLPACAYYERIGWDDHAALGLSIGCLFRYADMEYMFFDQHTLPLIIEGLLWDAPLLVSWNGRQFDGPLMLACDRTMATTQRCELWYTLWERSYDILHEIWQVSSDGKYAASGLNSLGAVSVANGYGTKAMDGAQAPRLWVEGRYAEVINYNMADVRKTRLLFEQVVRTGSILRGDKKPIGLPVPTWETLPLQAREG